MQLNSKFVNNMLPEWGRFMTAVKLNRGLRDSNYDQLYAYLKQHKKHAKENKMMLERFSQNTVDPLALMSNVSNPQHYSPSSSTQVPQPFADNPHLELSLSLAENIIENLTNTLALHTQSYKTFLPQTNNQLRTSSNARNQATGGSAAGYGGAQNRVGNVNLGQARLVKCYNCNGTEHIAQENGVALTQSSRCFLQVQDHDHYQDAVCAHHEEHAIHDSVQLDHVVDSHADYTSDSNMIPYDQYVKDNEVVQIILWYLDSGCSKHMTGDRSRLMNFVKKFIGTVRFGNDHFRAIIGYGDHVIGDSVISRKTFFLRSRNEWCGTH
nr:retrovirus-related Pol polyprotein from transposon TNT 1-94 [Tanacetum cinerariifolium]